MSTEKARDYNCPVEAAMDVVGGKYKAIIIYHLIEATLRYSQLQKLIPRATPKMLSQQLRELEADGIVRRVLYPVVPPRTEYSLTGLGRTLVPVVLSLCAWGEEFLKRLDDAGACQRLNAEPFAQGRSVFDTK